MGGANGDVTLCVCRWGAAPAALACLLRAVGLFRVDTGDGQPMGCLACCMLGVPGQEWEGSCSPAEVRVRVEELMVAAMAAAEDEEEEGEVERVTSAPSLRGCSWRMESWTNREGSSWTSWLQSGRRVGKHTRGLSQDPAQRCVTLPDYKQPIGGVAASWV